LLATGLAAGKMPHREFLEDRMRPDLAERTFEILLHGLSLRDRVAAGARPHVATEQAKLKALLGPNAGSPWGASGGEHTADHGHGGPEFLGIRYALACWLDEVLIAAGWREWDENKVEAALYRTNIRYGNFWTQARLAEAIPDSADAHEAFLWCVLLGFRGEMEHTPDQLREWVSAARARAVRAGGREPPAIPEAVAPKDPAPLRGEEAYRGAVRRLVVVALVAVPVLAFLLVLLFRKAV
jgi:type VI secretion system protein ImpK